MPKIYIKLTIPSKFSIIRGIKNTNMAYSKQDSNIEKPKEDSPRIKESLSLSNALENLDSLKLETMEVPKEAFKLIESEKDPKLIESIIDKIVIKPKVEKLNQSNE